MSFATDIYSLMIADTALNTAVPGGIYFQNLPDNPVLTQKYIIYTYSLTDSIDHLAKNNELDIFNLRITILAPDTNSLMTIVDTLRAYLDNLETSKFRDIKSQNSETETEGDREQYSYTINYKLTYQT